MTIDVATLVFEFKSDSAATAEQRMDALIAKADRLEASAKRVRLATDRVNEGHRGAAGAAERAAQGAMSLAQAEGAVERASRGVARASAEVRAQRALEAAAMRELVQATRAYERDQAKAAASAARAAREQAAAVSSLEARMAALKASIDPVGSAQDRVNAELREAAALYKMGAISAEQYAQAQRVLDERFRMTGSTLGGVDKSMRRTQLAAIGLGRQFADVGVTAAMGMNPFMILIQQGPQIVDQLTEMKQQGTSLSAAMKGLAVSTWAAVAPLLPFIAAAAGVAAVIGGTMVLAARKLNQENKGLVNSLGLTEDQLEKVKNKSITAGDVMVGTWRFAKKATEDIWKPIGKFFGDVFDAITRAYVGTAKGLVGGFVGAYEAIKATWKMLPAALADAAIEATNLVLRAAERMINDIIAKYNQALPMLRAMMIATGNVSGAQQLQAGRPVTATQFANPYAGQAGNAATVGQEAFSRGMATGASWVDQQFKAWGDAIVDAAKDRIRKEAGKDTGRTPKAPRDMTDERAAQLEGLLAQAMQEELQARLALTREVKERAEIEKQLVAFEVAEKQAGLNRQIAAIADDKGLSAAKKAQYTAELQTIKFINDRVGALKVRAIEEQAAADLAREAVARQEATLTNQIEALNAQAEITRSAFARSIIEIDILRAEQELERLKLEEVVASSTSTATEKAIAQSRLNTLGQVHQLELQQAQRQTRLVNAIGEATGAVRGFKDAFRRHDWARVFDELQRTIETIQASFAANGLGGGLLTAGSAAATLIGGRTGRAIGGGLGIAGAGFSAGSALMGAASMGALGSGAMAGMAMSIAPLLGPIALAAGALYAAAKIFNVGGKPTNAGAGFDLVTGAISGNKRTEETEGAAKSAGEAIRGIMDAVKAAGIGLTDAVTGLVIGTRDQTQIYLQSGKTLLSAVGDSGAAVDTAMKALLEGATYVSDAQKKLVESALATGKGFDAVAEVLARYEGAQKISAGLADDILRLTDPKAFDIQAVKRDIEEQRKAAQALATEGYLTADQLSVITGQLAALEGLRLDEVMKRYSDAVEEATDTTAEAARRAAEIALQRRGMEAELLRLRGDTAGATAIEQALTLEGIDASLHALQREIWAQTVLNEERERATALLEEQTRALREVEEAERARVAALAQEHAGLQLRLAQARGDDALVTRLNRERELADATDETSRQLLGLIHAQDDLNTATQRAKALAQEHAGLELRLAEVRGDDALVTRLRRERELADATDATSRTYLTAIYAAEDAATALAKAQQNLQAANDNLATAKDTLRAAYERERGEIEATISRLGQAADSLRDFRRELDFGSTAGRDPRSQYLATQREFNRLSGMAANDPERLANLQSVGQAFLQASRAYSPTTLAFDRDLNAVRRATEASQKAAESEADVARQQLSALVSQVGQLIELNANVKTVAMAIADLKGAMVAQAVATAAANGAPANDNFDVTRYIAANKDLTKNWQAGGSLRGVGASLEEAALAHYLTTGRYEIAAGLRGYATGGFHPGGLRLVGEEGPELEVTGPSQIFSARQTRDMLGGDNAAVVAELRETRAELQRVRSELQTIRRDTRETADALVGATKGDLSIKTEAA